MKTRHLIYKLKVPFCCRNFYRSKLLTRLRGYIILFYGLVWGKGREEKSSFKLGLSVKAKSEGGSLGVERISLKNRALLGKQLWRYHSESNALWHKIILSIYRLHSKDWDANIVARQSHGALKRPLHRYFVISLVSRNN